MPACTFAPVTEDHLETLIRIINYYILNTTVSFHDAILSAEDMREKVFFNKLWYGAFVIQRETEIIGYCAVSPWKKQEAYRHTAEVNIYLHEQHTGRGYGSEALAWLEDFAIRNDIQNLIAGVCSENIPSIRLFEKNGRLCARYEWSWANRRAALRGWLRAIRRSWCALASSQTRRRPGR